MLNKVLFMLKMLLFFLFLLPSFAYSSLWDNFNRADSTIVGNGWVEVTAGGVPDVRVTNNELVFLRNGYTGYSYAYVSHTFGYTNEVSMNGFISLDANYGTEGVVCRLFVENADGDFQYMNIYVDGTTNTLRARVRVGPSETLVATTSVAHDNAFHNLMYRYEDVGGAYQSRWYLDGNLVWTSSDGGIGMIARGVPLAVWGIAPTPNGTVKADDFKAGQIVTCQESWIIYGGMDVDLNKNCIVDLGDIAMFAEQWMACNDPSGC